MRTLEMVVESAPFSKITDDREFMKKFILLLSLIMGLSTYIIINAVNTVDDLSIHVNDRLPTITLEKIERQMNGNMISLEIVEDDFSELDSIIITREDLEKLPPIDFNDYQEDIILEVAPVTSIVAKVKQEPKKKKIFISSQKVNKGNSVDFIKKRFYATNSALFSIKLAKKFYESKSYKKALKWVLITNELDSKSEDSWVMFAKVKEKMGKRRDAITALDQYLKQGKSSRVQKLLNDLKKKV